MRKTEIPSIRFRGFDDAWEQRKLGDIVERVVRKNTNNESSLPLTISAQYGLVDQITYFNNRVASRDVSNYYLVLNGEFAYNKSTSDGFPFGAVKRLDLYEKGVLSTLYIVFSIKNQSEIDSDYLTVFFDTDRWHKGVSERAAEGARNHGLLNISADDFFDIDIFLPRHKEEQVAIGSYLRHLDHLITLRQRKFEKLTNVKKSMLKKMFPQNGSSYPAVRFNGFTDPWEQRKVLSCIQKITDFRGRTPKKLGMDWSESGYLALSALNVKDGYIDFSQDVHYGDRALYDKWMSGNELHKGQVLFTTEAPMGNVAQVPDNRQYILSQRTIAFDVREDFITENFLATLLRSPAVFNTLTSLSSGGTAKGVSQKSLAGVEVRIPVDLREQALLATYFHNLDNLITLHQRELEKLQGVKKSLLKKMFV